jgi:hypothetical protein
MFLVREQIKRFENYDTLSPRERATFNFRIADKVRTFLDDVEEVNRVLDTIPFNYHQKSVKEEHIDPVFNLLEKMLSALDYAPIVPDQDGTPHRFKGFQVAPRGGGPVGRYQTILPASDADIARNDHLQKRIRRLEQFTTARVTTNEFRPREYWGPMVDRAEKEGLVAVIPGFMEKIKKAKKEETISDVSEE